MDETNLRRNPPSFTRIIRAAILDPLNLGVAAAGIVGAMAIHLWPIAALGLAAYTALVAWDLVSPEFWTKALGQKPSLAGAPTPSGAILSPAAYTDPAAREAATAIVAARRELDRIRDEAEGDVAEHVAGLMVSVDELQSRAAGLLTRAEELASYLSKNDPVPLRAEIARLREKAAKAKDPEAKKQYESAAGTRQEQLDTLGDIGSALERLHANLSRIVATFEGVAAKIVRMGAMDAQTMDNLSGDMNQELAHMNGEIHTFEETLKTIASAEALSQ